MSQLKFSLKIWNKSLIGGRGPRLPGYALAQVSKNFPWQKKIRPVCRFAQSSRKPKKPAYCWLSSQVLFHPKLEFKDLSGLKKDFYGFKTAIFQILKTVQGQDQNFVKMALKSPYKQIEKAFEVKIRTA